MTCKNCEHCTCSKTVYDWVQKIVTNKLKNCGKITLSDDIYLMYENNVITGGKKFELDYYDLIVDGVEYTPYNHDNDTPYDCEYKLNVKGL